MYYFSLLLKLAALVGFLIYIVVVYIDVVAPVVIVAVVHPGENDFYVKLYYAHQYVVYLLPIFGFCYHADYMWVDNVDQIVGYCRRNDVDYFVDAAGGCFVVVATNVASMACALCYLYWMTIY